MGSLGDIWIFCFVNPKLLYALSCLNLPSILGRWFFLVFVLSFKVHLYDSLAVHSFYLFQLALGERQEKTGFYHFRL